MTTAFILVIAALLIWAWLGGREKARRSAPLTPRIRGPGLYRIETVGESYQRANFLKLRDRMRPNDMDDEWTGDATLHPVSTNPHDPNAVEVRIDGLMVSHLPRELAIEFRQALMRDGVAGYDMYAVGSRLYWGGDEGHFSVRIDLPET